VYGLVISPNQYGNENLLPVSCGTARGKEDSTLLTGYMRLSIDLPPGYMDLSAGLVPRGSGSSQEQGGQPGAQQFDLRPDDDGVAWDTPIGDALSVEVDVRRQITNLHIDPASNSGFKTVWCWYRASTFRRLYPEHQHTSDNELVRTLYQRAGLYGLLTFDQSFHPWMMLFQTIGVAIGIPFTILAFGYACSWALAGFRSIS
jgi:hypothetical protein